MTAIDKSEYYEAAGHLADMAALLPEEAYKAGFKIDEPPKLADADSGTPKIEKECRKYCEKYRFMVNRQIPKYVYQYFERGRKIKRGY